MNDLPRKMLIFNLLRDAPAMLPMIVLGSSSPYRRELMARLGLPFVAVSPDIDEQALPAESVSALVIRLSAAKARAIGPKFPAAIIVGSDQAAELDGRPIGKPGTRERAREQLTAASGRVVVFHTGLSLLDTSSGRQETVNVPTIVEFRVNDRARIEAYLDQEPALDCAGSFKSEGLGIALCERISSNDPTALVGLPLIALCRLLGNFGISLPGRT